jgi:hypothetical protein
MVDQWTELALVEVQKYGDTDAYQFGAITDTVDLDIGDRPIESTALINGGRIVKYTPEEDTTVTLEIFPVGAKANQTTPTGLGNWFYGDVTGTTQGAGAGTYYINTHSRYKFRVVVLWTSLYPLPVGSNTVSGALASGDHLRVSFWGSYLTSCKLAYTDDILTGTVNFVCPPYTKAGAGVIAVEEAVTQTLKAMQDYGATYSTPAWL